MYFMRTNFRGAGRLGRSVRTSAVDETARDGRVHPPAVLPMRLQPLLVARTKFVSRLANPMSPARATRAGRSPGSRVVARNIPSQTTIAAQWLWSQPHPCYALAAYSCRDSRRIGLSRPHCVPVTGTLYRHLILPTLVS